MKLRVPYKEIGRFIVLLFFLMPFVNIPDFNYVQGWEWLGTFSSALRLLRVFNLALGYSIVLVLGIVRKLEISSSCILCILPYVYLVVRTALAGGTRELKNLFVFLMMLLLADVIFLRKAEWFLTLVNVLNFFTLINFLFILRYIGQGGLVYYSVHSHHYWKSYYFLGYDNGFIVLFLLVMIFNIMLYHYHKKKKYLLMFGIQLFSEMVVFSACSLIICTVWGAMLLFSKRDFIGRIVYQPMNFLLAYLVLYYMVVIVGSQDLANAIFSQLFAKNLENARIVLWKEGLQIAGKHFLFGQGYMIEVFRKEYVTPHTMLLEWIVYGGIVFAILFFIAIFYSLQQLCKFKMYYEAFVIFSGIAAFMFGYIAEGYGAYISFWAFLFVLLIGANIERLHMLLQDKVNLNEN